MRDDSNNPNLSAAVKPTIHVFTSAGKPIAQLRVSLSIVIKFGQNVCVNGVSVPWKSQHMYMYLGNWVIWIKD